MKRFWWTFGAIALFLPGSAACGRAKRAVEVAPAPAPVVKVETPPRTPAPNALAPALPPAPESTMRSPRPGVVGIGERGRRMARFAFWNQPRTIAELGIGAGQRQRMDAILADFLGPLHERNQAQRAAVEGWIAALAAGEPEAAERHFARAAELAATHARANLTFKGRLLAELAPEARARLAQSYPRFLAAVWVHANRMVDTSNLSKWTEALPPGRRPLPQGQAGKPAADLP